MKTRILLPALVLVLLSFGVFALVTAPLHAQANTAPLCADAGGGTNPVVRASVPGGTVTNGSVFCQVIAANGTFVRSSQEIGDQAILSLGVVHAVDVFGITLTGGFVQNFNSSIQVCLQGSGTFFFLDARQSPRIAVALLGTQDGGFTCASISGPGTVVLTSGAPGQAPAAPQATIAGATPAPGSTVVPPISLTLAPGQVIDTTDRQCFGRTTRIVRLREEPNTTSRVIATLPFDRSYRVTGITQGWYRIVYLDGQAWVSAQFFRLNPGCI
ncbi:MAG: SH3 domain-containing protein [Chloroflexota bacterium]|nr:SH3 domain-containing protein [Chloroflexota bacterium]